MTTNYKYDKFKPFLTRNLDNSYAQTPAERCFMLDRERFKGFIYRAFRFVQLAEIIEGELLPFNSQGEYDAMFDDDAVLEFFKHCRQEVIATIENYLITNYHEDVKNMVRLVPVMYRTSPHHLHQNNLDHMKSLLTTAMRLLAIELVREVVA